MFRPGNWATAFLFVYLHCFGANRAIKLENIQACNRTKHILPQTYEIFEPRDWVEELKYLEDVEKSDKRALLQGTPYCQICFSTVQDSTNQLYCDNYCGIEIYNLKNRSNTEIQTLNTRFPVELKNRSIDLDTKITSVRNRTLDVTNAIYSIKNRSNTDSTVWMISNHTEVFDTVVQLNRTRAVAMDVMEIGEHGENTIAVITHNRTRSVDMANRTRTDGMLKIIVGNRTRTWNNGETIKNQRFSVANWIMARTKPQESTTVSKLMDGFVTPCAAVFMYAMSNPIIRSKT